MRGGVAARRPLVSLGARGPVAARFAMGIDLRPRSASGSEVAVDDQKKADLTEDDYAAMRKVVGYVKRHSAQRPDGDVTDTPWRYSLMNWGHDPKK